MPQNALKSPTVKVNQGFLRGSVKSNIDGGEYIYFQGIPFAEPPLGKLRFKVRSMNFVHMAYKF